MAGGAIDFSDQLRDRMKGKELYTKHSRRDCIEPGPFKKLHGDRKTWYTLPSKLILLRTVRRVFVPKRVVMSGSWTKLRNAELHHWFCLHQIKRRLNSRGIRRAGLVTHTWERRDVDTRFLQESLKERNHREDLEIDGTIIFKREPKETGYDDMDWINEA